MRFFYLITYIYVGKLILRHNSKNIARISAVIVNCEMCIATYILKISYLYLYIKSIIMVQSVF
ncbi:conserved protein of unknown function [Clostridium beijerinckii]|nr:conserved protein of unknown function [Clostridium beijerinckii]